MADKKPRVPSTCLQVAGYHHGRVALAPWWLSRLQIDGGTGRTGIRSVSDNRGCSRASDRIVGSVRWPCSLMCAVLVLSALLISELFQLRTPTGGPSPAYVGAHCTPSERRHTLWSTCPRADTAVVSPRVCRKQSWTTPYHLTPIVWLSQHKSISKWLKYLVFIWHQ